MWPLCVAKYGRKFNRSSKSNSKGTWSFSQEHYTSTTLPYNKIITFAKIKIKAITFFL